MTRANDANFYRDLTKRYPVIDHAKGVYVYDDQGNRYLDFGSGISVTSIGYSVDRVIQEMCKQLEKTTFVYNGYFTNEARIRLSEQLLKLCPKGMTKTIFASSGSEANEIAIKMARQYHCETGNKEKYKVISRRLSYHGNTLGSLSISGRPSWQEHFLPYMYDFPKIAAPYCYRCPFKLEYPKCGVRCAQDLEEAIISEDAQTVSAFIAEPVIGTTVPGATPVPEYFSIIRAICDKHDVLFIADEIITGIGRTGENFGIDNWHICPDIITVGKGLSAGYAPLSAVIVHSKLFDAISNGSRKHSQGFTYSGNPLSCAAGLAVLNYIEANDLVARSKERGKHLKRQLESLRDIDIVGDIRGKGLLLGIEFVADKKAKIPLPVEANLTAHLTSIAFEMGMILIAGMPGCADSIRGDQIQISPPFVIEEAEINKSVEILRNAVERCQEELIRKGFLN